MNEPVSPTHRSLISDGFVFLTRLALLGGLVSLLLNWLNPPDLSPLSLTLLGLFNVLGLLFLLRAAHTARPLFAGVSAIQTQSAGVIMTHIFMGTIAVNAMQYFSITLGLG